MSPIEKIQQLFEEITKGKYSTRDAFFETIWINFTRIAHHHGAAPLLAKIDDWAHAHAAEHPDFLELSTLTLGFIDFLADNFDSALKRLNKAYALFSERKDEDGVAACCICLGFLYRSTGEIDLALKYGLPGLEQLAHTGKYKMFRISGCYWIGGVYAETGHLDEALRLFQEGLKIDFPPGVEAMGARLTNGIAGVYMKQKKFNLALENYQKAIDLFNETTESTFMARGLTDLGDYHCKMGDYPKAIEYNQQALALRQEMKIQNGSITNFMNLGDLYNKQGKFKEAIDVLLQALKLAEEIGSSENIIAIFIAIESK